MLRWLHLIAGPNLSCDAIRIPVPGSTRSVLSFNQTLDVRVTRCRCKFCDMGSPHELVEHLCSRIWGVVWLHAGRRAVSVKTLLKQYLGRGNRIVIIMAAGFSRSKLVEGINYQQNDHVVAVWWANFKVVVLDRLIEILTLDIFQVKPNVTRFVTYFMVRERHWLTYWPTLRRMPGQLWRSFIRASTLAMLLWPMDSWARKNKISCLYSCDITIMHGGDVSSEVFVNRSNSTVGVYSIAYTTVSCCCNTGSLTPSMKRCKIS